jgi:hypothetical protein
MGATSDIIYPTDGSKLSGIPSGKFAVPRMSLDDVFQAKGCKQKDELAAWTINIIANLLSTWHGSSVADKCAEIAKRKQNIKTAQDKATWGELDCALYMTDRIMLNNMDASICDKPIDLIDIKMSSEKVVNRDVNNAVKAAAKLCFISMDPIQKVGDCDLFGWIDYEAFNDSPIPAKRTVFEASESAAKGYGGGYEIHGSLYNDGHKNTTDGYFKIWFSLNDYDKSNSNDYFHMEGGCKTTGTHNGVTGQYYAIVKFSEIPTTGIMTKTFTFCENGCNSCASKPDKAIVTFSFRKQ